MAIKVGVTEFPPLFFLALRFLAIAVLRLPLVAVILVLLPLSVSTLERFER